VLWERGPITIKGHVYAALTDGAFMVGGSVAAVYEAKHGITVRAWFTSHFDALVQWKPFSADIALGLRSRLAARVPVGFTGEYNYASGDADPTDGTRGTFDQLYPTGHDKYGLADQVGWRNIHHLRTGVDVTPMKALLLTASYHSWWLAERNDALYSAGSAVIARAPGGAISRHVGQEIDVQASRPITPHVQVSGGYAYIFPGAFLKQTTPGASYGYPYVMATYVFLADR